MNPRNFLLVDFEYRTKTGNPPEPVCVVMIVLETGGEIRLWLDGIGGPVSPPIDLSQYTIVAYYALAELSCIRALGWPQPAYVLDLYVEFKNLVNGTLFDRSLDLLSFLSFSKIKGIDQTEKDGMRDLILRQTKYTEKEKESILDYCASDVRALLALMRKINL